MGNALKILWKLPVVKHAIKNKILLQDHHVFNKIVKSFLESDQSQLATDVISAQIKELVYPFRDDLNILYFMNEDADTWIDLIENLKYRMKNTAKLRMIIDKHLALKLKPLQKFLTPPEGVIVNEAFAFKLGRDQYFVFSHHSDDSFVKDMFNNFYYQFVVLAQSLNSKQEKFNLSAQIEHLQNELDKSNDKVLEMEKKLKKRIHEIDQIFEVSNELFTIHDRGGLINTALLTLVGQLGCDSAFLLLRNEKDGDFNEFHAKGFGVEQNSYQLEHSHPLIQYFENGGEILYYDETRFRGELAELLPFIKETKARMIAPVMANEKLIGIMVCGEKLFGGSYDPVDHRIFKVLSNTVNLAFTNLQVYEKAAGDSFVDKNTGIANRKYFEKRVQEEKSRVLRQNSSLGMLTIQLQNLQLLEKLDENQRNQFDRLMAQQLSSVVRTEDFLAYLEPGSMVLLMPGITDETIGIALTRFKNTLDKLELPDDLPLEEVAFNFDFVIFPEQEEKFEKMLDQLVVKEVEEEPGKGEEFFSDLDFGL